MRTSDKIDLISVALVEAQKLMESAIKGSSNPHFRSTYADLASVVEACKDPLNKHGISVIQPTSIHYSQEGKAEDVVITRLQHVSGQFIESITRIKVKGKDDDPQAYVAGITYARRAGLQSLVGLPAEDDDGNTAAGVKSAPQRQGSFRGQTAVKSSDGF